MRADVYHMVEIDTLDAATVDDALRLSTQAGWNQVAADWKRFLALCPEGCFGSYLDGNLVGTTCVLNYEDGTSWVGMVLVDEQHRRQGHGTALFEHALDHADDVGGPVGLDATAYGASLYREYGFHRTAPVERWSGTLDPVSADCEAVVLPPSQADALPAFDATVVGTDRKRFLDRLLSEIGVTALGVLDGDELAAYAIVRPGRDHPQFGPAVAPDGDHFAALLEGTRDLLADPTVVLDVFPNSETVEMLRRHGLDRKRELTRMVRGIDATPLAADDVRAISGFAWG